MQMWLKLKLIFMVLALRVNGLTLQLNDILERLQNERQHESLLLLQGNKDDCWGELQGNTSMPLLNLNEGQSYQLKKSFNKRILAVVCVRDNAEDLMETLYDNLHEMRNTPTLLLVEKSQNLEAIFKDCRLHQMLNVLALKRSYGYSFIYSFTAFPRLEVKRRRLSHIRIFYKPQMRNLHQHTIIAMPRSILPRCVVYKDAEGHVQIKGYLTRFVRQFACHLNASLDILKHYTGDHLEHEVTASMMNNGTLDILLSLINPTFRYHMTNNFYTNSQVMQTGRWSLMLPVEPPMRRSSFFFNIETWIYGCCLMCPFGLCLCNALRFAAGMRTFSLCCWKQIMDPVLRAILSQTIVLAKRRTLRLALIYWLLFMSGLFNCNIYTANLATLFLNPPAEHRKISYEDMRMAGMKIFLHNGDAREMEDTQGEILLRDYSDLLVRTDSGEDFQRLRSELNPAFAYPVTHTLWPLLKEKQKKLKRPIFRLSRKLQFIPFVLFVLPLAKNSIYEDVFNDFLLKTQSSGLLSHWFQLTFDELKNIGQLTYSKQEPDEGSQNINCDDLFWVYLLYLVGVLLSLMAFGFELLYQKWTKK